MQKRSPVRARAVSATFKCHLRDIAYSSQYENTYSMFRKKKQDERVNMARAVRDTLTLESQVASSQVTEGERLLQLLRDNAQVAQLRVEEMNEDIGHMLEEFRQEALTPEEAGSTKTGVGSKFDSDVEAPLSVKGSLDDDTSETNESQDDEEEGRVIKDEAVREVSGSIPLTESALKRLNDSDNNLG
jgi:hypothetical protein